MKPEGLKAFSIRAASKSKIYSHEQEKEELDVEYEKQFKNEKIALDFFEKQSPSYKKVMKHWIMSAKQEKTRQSRLDKTIDASRQLKRLD